jgi:hypothetical protein
VKDNFTIALLCLPCESRIFVFKLEFKGFFCCLFEVLGIKLRAFYMPGKQSTIELPPQSLQLKFQGDFNRRLEMIISGI